MSNTDARLHLHGGHDHAPGDEPVSGHEIAEGLLVYIVGLFLAALITAVAFFLVGTDLVWRPSIPVALLVLAVAQMGVHLVFFLHITTGPDNSNNVLALAFGVLIVALIMIGSLWIMANMNQNMTPMHM
ncbi:MAG: cytochrome o ubiquinol oxidase subunit IV [Hyphomicrobiales bacterium]|jgi:cytochrome o ubiquinol oxidase subunit IV|nr:cytochrome o ubiquinol oxidase subunit IV [Hyphomicrobiales bacterium]MBV9909107.1 cytochrome o ubiquinol oxidase subunit IV [Hyphomicrobiales bacterium]